MKKWVGFWVIMGLSLRVLSEELPKSCYGRFGGEMPAHSIIVDDQSIAISAHDVFITITADKVVYSGGNLELIGTYTVYKQGKNEYIIKANLTNGKSLNYELDFTWKKKEDKLYITPKNGQVEAVLERISV